MVIAENIVADINGHILVPNGYGMPAAGWALITGNGLHLYKVEIVELMPDGSVRVKVAQSNLSQLGITGEFSFVEDDSVARLAKLNPQELSASANLQILRVSIPFSEDIDLTDDGAVVATVEGVFDLNGAFGLSFDVGFAGLNTFTSSVGGEAALTVDMALIAEAAASFSHKVPVGAPAKQYYSGLIGLVPVIVEVTTALYLGIEGNAVGGATLESGVNANAAVVVGARYDSSIAVGGRWSPIAESGFDWGYDEPSLCYSGAGSVRIYLQPHIEVQLYSAIGPTFDIEPYARFDASLEGCLGSAGATYDAQLTSGAVGYAKIKADVLDQFVIESPRLTVFDISTVLKRWHNAPPAQPPAQPQGPSPDDGATDISIDVDLDWANASRAERYEVYFGTDPTPDSTEFLGNTVPSSYSLGQLAYDTTYYWRIVAVNGAGTTEGSIWAFSTKPAPLAPPEWPHSPVPANGATNVPIHADLDWANAPRADSYDVYFGTDPTPDSGEYMGSTAASSFILADLSHNTQYFWQVIAKNSAGSAASAVWAFSTEAEPVSPPGQPQGPNPAHGAINVSIDADLDWADAQHAIEYDVYFGTSSPVYVGTTAGSFWSLGTLQYANTYLWQVVARNATGEETAGNTWGFSTEPLPLEIPSAPQNPTPPPGAIEVPITTNLDWGDSDRADSYDLYFGTISPPPLYAQDLPASVFDLPVLAFNTWYYWRVVPRNAAGPNPGQTWSFRTSVPCPGTPSNPSPLDGASNVPLNVTLSWAATEHTDNYDVYYGPAGSSGQRFNTPTNSIDVGLQPNMQYCWYVVAINPWCSSPPSPTWCFTTTDSLPADLLVESTVVDPPNPTVGQSVGVWATVRNIGNAVSPETWLDLWKDGASQPVDCNTSTYYRLIPQLSPGESREEFWIISYQSSGAKKLWAIVDCFDQVVESNEDNNVQSRTIVVSP